MRENMSDTPSRRAFLHGSAAAAAAATVSSASRAAETGTLRIGLIGCGGRGTGAAEQALKADRDVQLVAMGDAFEDRLQKSLTFLQKEKQVAAKVHVNAKNCFVGFDAYKKVIESGVDVVLLATPPGFRPMHLAAAVEAGKHVFAEKPVAVDAPGVRSVLASCAQAQKKHLSVVSGLCLRYDNGFREIVRRLQGGAIGKIVALQANDLRGPNWGKERQDGWSDMEHQMRNWYNFVWLSGDFNVEQHVHFLDVCAWVMKDEHPVRAVGLGGRQSRTAPEHGHIYDHFSVVYEYPSGAKLFSQCRQQKGCKNDISAHVIGTKGTALLSERRKGLVIRAEKEWTYAGPYNNMYQTEHDELFASIRAGKPINDGVRMAHSTLLAIMGRMAAYTGKEITWQMAMESKETLRPSAYNWTGKPPPAEIAIPGRTRFS
jgi:predicted dehydrogenase